MAAQELTPLTKADELPAWLVREAARDYVELAPAEARIYFEAMAGALGFQMALMPAAA